jgi:hypothetical protein
MCPRTFKGGSKMAKKVLDNITGGNTWTSYISGVYGVLTAAGMWRDEVYKLMGMTGMAFHFIVHENCCPSSVTVYDWVSEHTVMLDRIGVYSDVYQSYNNRSNTYELRHRDAVKRIKESIDRGVGVVVWAPTSILEFGFVKGYDDEDGVFIVGDCTGQEVDPLLYGNLGKSDVPMLFYQIFREKVETDPQSIYKESLKFAVSEWEKEFHVNSNYASGRKGYKLLLASLEKGDFDVFGLPYILAVYLDSKKNAAQYLAFLDETQPDFKGLGKAAELSNQISEKYEKLTRLFPFSGSNGIDGTADRSKAPEGLKLVRECFELEEQAMNIIKSSLV